MIAGWAYDGELWEYPSPYIDGDGDSFDWRITVDEDGMFGFEFTPHDLKAKEMPKFDTLKKAQKWAEEQNGIIENEKPWLVK